MNINIIKFKFKAFLNHPNIKIDTDQHELNYFQYKEKFNIDLSLINKIISISQLNNNNERVLYIQNIANLSSLINLCDLIRYKLENLPYSTYFLNNDNTWTLCLYQKKYGEGIFTSFDFKQESFNKKKLIGNSLLKLKTVEFSKENYLEHNKLNFYLVDNLLYQNNFISLIKKDLKYNNYSINIIFSNSPINDILRYNIKCNNYFLSSDISLNLKIKKENNFDLITIL